MNQNDAMIAPIRVTDDECQAWAEAKPLAFRVAQFWATHAPRGKGALPRWLGRTFGKNWHLLIRSKAGPKMAVDPSNLDMFTFVSTTGGYHEIINTCARLLSPTDVFYDIGANIGYISQSVAAKCPGVRVISFEPQGNLARNIAISAKINGHNITVYSTLLGSKDGEANLFIPPHCIHASTDATHFGGGDAVSCSMWRLDTLIDSGVLPPPNVIKIDVEGSEEQVFAGAEKLLRSAPPAILFEAYPGSQAQLKKVLLGYGDFHFFGARSDGFIPAATDGEDSRYTDVVAIPSSSAQRLREAQAAMIEA